MRRSGSSPNPSVGSCGSSRHRTGRQAVSQSARMRACLAGYRGSKGLPMPEVLAALTNALELGGGILLMIGYKVRIVSILFFLWLIPTTLLFHKFWGIDAAQVQNQMNNFLKNVSIMGAM